MTHYTKWNDTELMDVKGSKIFFENEIVDNPMLKYNIVIECYNYEEDIGNIENKEDLENIPKEL